MSGAPPTGNYPGNLSLPAEVREKILSTFRHTLDLYRDGKVDDCLIGCDFILKMDPRFGPARQLQEKASNPKADVNIEELRAILEASSAAPVRRDTAEVPLATSAAPPPEPVPELEPAPDEGLDSLSLDSLSLDSLSLAGPASDLAAPGFSPPPGRGAEAPFDDMGLPPETSEEQIALLLRQGDEARTAGDKQQAIEIWSRIFLIDINNADAVERIEETRRDMSEESRRVAAALEEGRESYARGDLDAARKQFDAVIPPEERVAPPPPGPAPRPEPPNPHDLSAMTPAGDVLAEEMDHSGPPDRRPRTGRPNARAEVSTPAEPAPLPPPRAGVRVNPRIVGIAAVVLALVAGWAFFFSRRPARTEAPPAGAGPSLEHATDLFREGKIAETTAELRRIPPSSPDYANAQKLLASLGPPSDVAPVVPAQPAAAAGSSAAPSDAADRRADAERALSEKRYIDAMKDFSLAEPAFRGDPTFGSEMAAASERVTELTPAVKLYNEGEYESAIPMLWRIYQAQRDNQDARSYLLRSYFNQGIAQLQNGLYEKAKESFGEAIALDPQDADAARHRQFAERYKSGNLDLLARIYVRYLSPRP
ncbi:MAG: tetratricopeptide repeat protein [Acidobacteriota bacterium]